MSISKALWFSTIILALAPGARAQPTNLQALLGDWSGPMPVQPPQTLIIHVRKAATGGVEATLDSPERRVSGVPMTGPHLNGSKVDFEIDAVKFRYEGMLSADGRTIHGTMTQGGAPPASVTLARGR